MNQYYECETIKTSEMCDTEVEVFKLTYKWTIKSFSVVAAMFDDITSPYFSAKCSVDPSPSWFLTLKMGNEAQKYIQIYITSFTSTKFQIRAGFKFSLLNEKGEAVRVKVKKTCNLDRIPEVGSETFLKKSSLHEFIRDDKLSICCEITYMLNKFDANSDLHQNNSTKVEMCQDFKNFMDDDDFSDVTLCVEGKEFRAHKSILAARSVVFAAMFKHPMQERKANRVFITDINCEVFKQMLNFIYSGSMSVPDDIALDLLAAADKYALMGLKRLCERKLISSLSLETAVETLILADRHSSFDLKKATTDFINSHAAEVVQTQAWENMNKFYPHLVTEAYQHIAVQSIKKFKACS